MFIELKVSCIVADPFTDTPVVILTDEKKQKSLPLWVGVEEANAIAIEIKQMERPRPLTHDLMKNMIEAVQCRLLRVEITELKDSVFFSRLVIGKDGEELFVDSRPSDAIALALRTDSRILVEEEVINMALSAKTGGTDITGGEILENLPPEDFGKYKM